VWRRKVSFVRSESPLARDASLCETDTRSGEQAAFTEPTDWDAWMAYRFDHLNDPSRAFASVHPVRQALITMRSSRSIR
jgi:hypothetical protein